MMDKPLKILLVDDDEVSNFIAEELMSGLGVPVQVHTSLDGRQGIQHLQGLKEGEAPDLILLDINMPELDGFGFLEEFATLPAHQRSGHVVVMLGATLTPDDMVRLRSMQGQPSNYVEKPLNKDVLLNLVNTYFKTTDNGNE